MAAPASWQWEIVYLTEPLQQLTGAQDWRAIFVAAVNASGTGGRRRAKLIFHAEAAAILGPE